MHLHEYQAKQIFAEHGVPVPHGAAVAAVHEVDGALGSLPGEQWLVKAQVHAGGRGKAGGIRQAEGREALHGAVSELLSSRLVTHQTGPEGLPVDTVLIESASDVQREIYLGMLVDRACERVAVMASAAGGVDIEQVAADTPGRILTEHIHPATGLRAYQGRKLGFGLGLEAAQVKAFVRLLQALYELFLDNDASLVEINPLAVTGDGDLVALDAKINLDDSALPLHPELEALRDVRQEDEREARAREHGLSYIRLDGTIGCMVNGAGLAMATMDLIKVHGGEPANFLDVGGNATADRVAEAFKLLLADPHVQTVLINIFGGIVRCDLIAEGILQAVAGMEVKVPVVVRLEGTNVEQGRRMLGESGFDITTAEDLTDAARQAVALGSGR